MDKVQRVKKKIMKKTVKTIFWMIADFIIIISGIYIAYLIRYFGKIPDYNFIPFTRIWYLFGVTGIASLYFFGLYKIEKKMNNKEIMLRSFKAIGLAIIIMMDIAYIMRERIMSFPTSVFILGIIINTILCGFWRIFILFDDEEEGKGKK